MQKNTNAKTVGAVYIYTPYIYKIRVQENGSKIENKKVIKMIKIDEAKTYGKAIGF